MQAPLASLAAFPVPADASVAGISSPVEGIPEESLAIVKPDLEGLYSQLLADGTQGGDLFRGRSQSSIMEFRNC